MSAFNTSGLVNKFFDLGRQDCFTLVMDFFRTNFGIIIPDVARPNDWDPETDNLIDKHWIESGFQKLDVDENWPPRPADVLVCTVGGSVPNHLVVYLGGNRIIHHKVGMMSGEEVMRPAWKRYTSFILRHPDVKVPVNNQKSLTLREVYDEGLV